MLLTVKQIEHPWLQCRLSRCSEVLRD